MKVFFLLAVLALSAATASAEEFEEDLSQGRYQQCQEEQMMLSSCRDYLTRRCTASSLPITWPWKRGMKSCQAVGRRCCQELEQTPPRCRCRAICVTVHGGASGSVQQGQMTQVLERARSLPATCNVYPSYCHTQATGGCY